MIKNNRLKICLLSNYSQKKNITEISAYLMPIVMICSSKESFSTSDLFFTRVL